MGLSSPSKGMPKQSPARAPSIEPRNLLSKVGHFDAVLLMLPRLAVPPAQFCSETADAITLFFECRNTETDLL